LNDGAYTYYVRCKDAAGNTNISSAKIAFTVSGASGNDTTPPSITNIKASPASVAVGASITITATVTDKSGIKSVNADIQNPDGNTVATFAMKDDGKNGDGASGDGIYGVVIYSESGDEGTAYIDITATDEYGNSVTKNNGATITITSAAGRVTL